MGSKRKAGPEGRRERRESSKEFIAEAVRRAAERRATGSTLTQLGRALDARWMRGPTSCACGARGTTRRLVLASPGETVEQEKRRLRRQMAVLRQKQAFARQVAVYFAKGSR